MKLNQISAYARKSRQRRSDSMAVQLKVLRRYGRQRGIKIVRLATDGEV